MDEGIGRAREAALQVLKPSARDLEHGLELHADCIVVDAYGFAPRFGVDGEALRLALAEGASERELSDMREEMWMAGGARDADQRARFIEAWEASGVTCVVQNAGQEGMEIARILKRLAHFTYLTDVMRDDVARAVAPGDILSAKENGRRCLYLSANGIPVPLAFRSVEEELSYIKIFFELGVRLAHLTYNRRNLIGDGCGETSDGGLSDFGRAVVGEMNRVGMIVDVSHSGRRTSYDAAVVSEGPICASHTVCCAVNDHFRGKPDDVIRAIVEKGGFVGICCVPGFLGRSGDIAAVLDHVDHMVRTFGAAYAAIGTDWAYALPDRTPGGEDAVDLRRTRPHWDSLWPDEFRACDPQCNPRWARQMETLSWTNWPLFTVGLVQRGYSDEDVRKIIGGNVLRVAGEALREAE